MFSAAPPTEEYPEGGLRLSMVWKSTYDLYARGSGEADVALASLPMATISAPASVRAFSDYFRRFRYRLFEISLLSERATSETGHTAIGYDRSAALAVQQTSAYGNLSYDVSATAANAYVESLQQSLRLPIWGSGTVQLISDRSQNDKNAQLFYMSPELSVTSPDQGSALMLCAQGAVASYSSAVSSTTDKVLTHEAINRAVLDLYGFVPTQTDITPELARRRASARQEAKTPSLKTTSTLSSGLGGTAATAGPDGDYELVTFSRKLGTALETKVESKGGSLR
jgi:hypothetical protein